MIFRVKDGRLLPERPLGDERDDVNIDFGHQIGKFFCGEGADDEV